MTPRTAVLLVAGLAALSLPIAASAQSWGGDYASGRSYSYGGRYAFRGYPEFRSVKAHIRSEIRQGLEEGWLDEDQAQDFNQQLRQIQQNEAQEYRAHGWNLPENDRADIRSGLQELDQAVDEARDES